LDGWERVRFTAPVFIGDTIRAERTLELCDERDADTGVLAYEVKVFNQRDEVVMLGTERLLIRRRSASSRPAGG
jgi:acyl dehydratase